ncbi:NADP-dependent D-sorbitol-6-phosphate dehydrogenase-like isoform X1 [Miscanthus floridulus]|uniref:NADP-dependent D-sorbitol-6-phosphate dehydrogenase-like isoform X1 n=1 Tax=Miscanthus floridulus TaxID=154761 RepID=UPI00345A965B
MKSKSVMHSQREDLFITTKLWNTDHGHVLDACKDSLKKLQLDYLDLYLIHFPVATRHTGVGTTSSALGDDGVLDIDSTISLETTWHAMEELVSMGLVRSIGISNTICRAWLRNTARRRCSLSSGGVCSVTQW